MKEVSHKITSLLLAIVVLFTTMSFTIDMHYCGDTLIDTAVFSKVHTCGMDMEKPSTTECSVTKSSCCSDDQITFEGQDELKLSLDSLTLDQQLFVTSFAYSYLSLFEDIRENTSAIKDTSPLLVVKTIYKLDETYLI